ncbi:glucose-fructose oxidoreductase domain-containing protein 2 [Clupea harengus]|uniref:Glucose-fructose oxidoreductase domain-containing protein 2 n=1 Tax=Clupea harengus TaxID=7950 RepID=A0A6P8FAR7_CLUHA|nr:glucose-fructose oxidoreductase domain-containing protein 2 [Clupea harengus]XP_031425618.1 glucose-fructose oxidoreductase domain-containing protein 2 [Clupea harengus]
MLPGVGVFGTGRTVRILVPLLREQGFPIHALWGRNEEEAESFARELGIPFCTSQSDDVLLHPDVHLVCIYTPPPHTRQIAVKALGIGKNVISEMAASCTDALQMVAAARYYPQLLSIMANALRFLPAFVLMRRLIEEGYCGALQVCEARVYGGSLLSQSYGWAWEELMGGGGLHIIGWCIIDILSHLIGSRALRVHGILRTFGRRAGPGIRSVTADDYACFQMLMSGGVVCSVTLNFNLPGSTHHEVMAVGSTGHLVVRGTELWGHRHGDQREELLLNDNSAAGPAVRGLIAMVTQLRLAFEAQEDCCSWERPPVAMAASFEDGLYVHAVVEAVKRASRSGEWEAVQLATKEAESNHNQHAVSH